MKRMSTIGTKSPSVPVITCVDIAGIHISTDKVHGLQCMSYWKGLLHHLFVSHMQVGHSQSVSPVYGPNGTAQIPLPLQAFCSPLPIQRGKIIMASAMDQEPQHVWMRIISSVSH